MDESRSFFHFRLTWTPERQVVVHKGSGWTGRLLILCGPAEPEFPDHPISKREFYALLGDLAARGFMDNLLDF